MGDPQLTVVCSVRHAAFAAVLVQRLNAAGIAAGCVSGHDTISDAWRLGYRLHEVVVPRGELEAAHRIMRAMPSDAANGSLPPPRFAAVGGSALGVRLGRMLTLLGALGSLVAVGGGLWSPVVVGLTAVFLPLTMLGGMVVAWSSPREVETAH